tara:strand:- start:30 stop:416 length:387 start_codon:yes stop_codon:yes gene_type:complete
MKSKMIRNTMIMPIYDLKERNYKKIISTLIENVRKIEMDKIEKTKLLDYFSEISKYSTKYNFTQYLIKENAIVFNKSYRILFNIHKYFIQTFFNKSLPFEIEKYILTFVGVSCYNYPQVLELIKMIFI